ncbi:hypothetical protein AVEN_171860-1 [Araneus ventricosus]|uniref:Uncharacterized protein n=1 Tax=Araneus ventricosus TaxID=182803 RepID=A0A4Y2XB97_ARAVE|nr:hypothetical protein AVEN_171860-1 [Araneus ventricosus]
MDLWIGFVRPVPPFLLTTGGGRYEWQAFHLSPKGPFNDTRPTAFSPLSEQQPAEIRPTSVEVSWPVMAGLGVRVLRNLFLSPIFPNGT